MKPILFILSTVLLLPAFWGRASCSGVGPYELIPGELFPHGRPVGQPYTARHPEIRMVRVSSVQEAERFREALAERYPECRIRYTRRVPPGTFEVGILRILDAEINGRGIAEIHFVETVKPAKKL